MTTYSPVDQLDKLTRFYSERREREVLVRVHYSVEESAGCKMYALQAVEELE